MPILGFKFTVHSFTISYTLQSLFLKLWIALEYLQDCHQAVIRNDTSKNQGEPHAKI